MNGTVQGEIQVLRRIIHVLSEGSVDHLMRHDESFARYIDQLYDTLDDKTQELSRMHRVS